MLRVLLVDETDDRAEVLRAALGAAGHTLVARVLTTVDLPGLVAQFQPDVIIIDTDSPDRDTLEHIYVVSQGQPRPIVLFSHDGEREKIRAAVQAGVSAYVVDGFAPQRINPVIDVAVEQFNEHQKLRARLAEANRRLDERKLIERAKGILMKQKHFGEDEAYRALRKMAMDKNLRLAELAEKVVSAAALLG